MPSVSDKQHKFMEAVAHDATFAQKVGVSQKVGKDFADADKNKPENKKKAKDKKTRLNKMYPTLDKDKDQKTRDKMENENDEA
jgi:hypothetical protein